MQGCSLEVMDIEQAQKEGLKVEITCRQNGPQRRVSAWRPVLVPYIAPAEGSDWHPPTCMHDCLAASGNSETGALQLAPIASLPEMGVCLRPAADDEAAQAAGVDAQAGGAAGAGGQGGTPL